MYFLLPSVIWAGLLTMGDKIGMCDEEIGFFWQLVGGACFAFVYKFVYVVFFTPMSFIESVCVRRKSCCGWLGDRTLLLLSFTFIEIPLAACFLIGLHWTQEYFFLVCFFMTGFLRLVALSLFPYLTNYF